MDAHAILNIIFMLLAAGSPFVLKKVDLKGPKMAWFSFVVAGVLAVLAMVFSGDVNGIGKVASDPTLLAKFVAEFYALQQIAYATLKDKFLL